MANRKKKPNRVLARVKATGIIRGRVVDRKKWDGRPVLHVSLAAACQARNKEFRTPANVPGLFWGNELGGEAGEAVAAMLGMLNLQALIGKAINTIKKLERERMKMAGSRAKVAALEEELADIVISVQHNCNHWGINLHEAIRKKFNKTSETLGMRTYLSVAWRETATEL